MSSVYDKETISQHRKLIKAARNELHPNRELVKSAANQSKEAFFTKMMDMVGRKKVDDAMRKAFDTTDIDEVIEEGGQAAGKTMQEGAEEGLEEGVSEGVEEAGQSGLGLGGQIAAGTGLAGAAGAGGYASGHNQGVDEGEKNRNLSYGAGLATGAVAPELTRRGAQVYENM